VQILLILLFGLIGATVNGAGELPLGGGCLAGILTLGEDLSDVGVVGFHVCIVRGQRAIRSAAVCSTLPVTLRMGRIGSQSRQTRATRIIRRMRLVAVADVPGGGRSRDGADALANLLADRLTLLCLSDDLSSVVCHEGGHVQGGFVHALSIGGLGGLWRFGGHSAN